MDITILILNLIMIILGLYLALFKSYFQEKGKNIATKEDVEGITLMVENVKSEIQYQRDSKYSLKSEERKTIVDTYEKFHSWLATIEDTFFGGIRTAEQISELERRIEDAYFEFRITHGKSDLFIDNQEIIDLLSEVRKVTFKKQQIAQRFAIEWEGFIFKIEQVKEFTPLLEQKEKLDLIYPERKAANSTYLDEMLDASKEINPIHVSLRETINKYLNDLSSK
jgi:hypothetical protein